MVQTKPLKLTAVAWKGTATILAGQETVTVTHNLGYVPTVDKIIVTPQDSLAGYDIWSDTPTATTFVLHRNSILGENQTFNVVILDGESLANNQVVKQFSVPYNAKIADITHADTSVHYLDLAVALPETRKIIKLTIRASRISGTGELRVYSNEGAAYQQAGTITTDVTVTIAAGTQRLKYNLTVANDDFDLYCFGYDVEA